MSTPSRARRTAPRSAEHVDITLHTLVEHTAAAVAFVVDAASWAEDEIARATIRHPGHEDLLYHTFELIRPGHLHPRLIEFVYRSHAAELLDRVVSNKDTRTPTAAEMCVACAEVSQRIPLHGPAAGIYLRLWARAFPDAPATPGQNEQLLLHEKLHGHHIDELEHQLRTTLRDPRRQLPAIVCGGRHHGQPVTCRYATPTPVAVPARRTRRAR